MAGLGITVSAKDEASPVLDRVKQALVEWKDTLVSLDSAINLVGKAWDLAVGAIKGGADVFSGLVKDAMEAEKAERDLGAALAAQGHNVDQILPKLLAFNAQIEAGTGIDGDAINALQAKLTLLGVLPKNLEAATVAAIGWARTTGTDMQSAAVAVTKAIMGKTAQLEKMGVHVKNSTEAVAFMSRGFTLVIAEVKTLEGRLGILNTSWDNLKEEMGKVGTSSDAIKDSISTLAQFVVELQKVFASSEGQAAVDNFFRGMVLWVADGIDAMLGMEKAGFKLVEFWQTDLPNALLKSKIRFLVWQAEIVSKTPALFDPIANEIIKLTGMLEKPVAKPAFLVSLEQALETAANRARAIGLGKKIEFPDFVMPKVKFEGQDGADAKADAAAEKALDDAIKRLEKHEAERLKLIGETAEKAAHLREAWDKHVLDNKIAIDKEQAKLADKQWKEFGERLKEADDLVEKEAKQMESTLSSIVGPAVGSLGGALKDMVLGNKSALDSMLDAWASFRDAMLAMLEQIIAKFIVMTIIEGILGLVTGGGSVAVQAATGAVTGSFDPGGLIFGSSGAGLRSSGTQSVGTSSSPLRGGDTFNFQTMTLPSRAEYQRHLRDTLEPAMRARARTR